jgi:hypothetical protein
MFFLLFFETYYFLLCFKVIAHSIILTFFFTKNLILQNFAEDEFFYIIGVFRIEKTRPILKCINIMIQ